MATSAFLLGRRRWSSPQQWHLHCLHPFTDKNNLRDYWKCRIKEGTWRQTINHNHNLRADVREGDFWGRGQTSRGGRMSGHPRHAACCVYGRHVNYRSFWYGTATDPNRLMDIGSTAAPADHVSPMRLHWTVIDRPTIMFIYTKARSRRGGGRVRQYRLSISAVKTVTFMVQLRRATATLSRDKVAVCDCSL